MKKHRKFFFWAICGALLAGALGAGGVRADSTMPPFALQSIRDGKTIASDSFSGKVLLLTFFATWCPPCVQEVPVLKQLQAEYGDAGFSVIGLSVDQQGPPVVATFVEKNQINYPVLMAEAKTIEDFGGVYGIPVAFLVNKSGQVVKKYTGYVQHTVLEKDIVSLLK